MMGWRDWFRQLWRSKTMLLPKDMLGKKGEIKAVQFLKSQGYKILDRNVQFTHGEIDIIARKDHTLVIIEVKTRRTNIYYHPREAVDRKKQRQIKRLGMRYYYLKQYHTQNYAIRFDIVTLIWPEGTEPKIEHFIDAFT